MLSAILLTLLHRPAPLRVVIDCGHGGSDPGMHFYYHGQLYHEASITYQVGLRVFEKCQAAGLDSIMTTHSPRAEQSRSCLTLPTDAYYTVKESSRVHANVHGCSIRTNGLDGRSNIFLSLHTDDVGKVQNLQGGTLYQEKGDCKPCSFTQTLWRFLKRAHLQRKLNGKTDGPAMRNENLLIYNCPWAKNIQQKVLYEMGVPGCSERDAWLLTTPAGQDLIAGIIVKALLAWQADNYPS